MVGIGREFELPGIVLETGSWTADVGFLNRNFDFCRGALDAARIPGERIGDKEGAGEGARKVRLGLGMRGGRAETSLAALALVTVTVAGAWAGRGAGVMH